MAVNSECALYLCDGEEPTLCMRGSNPQTLAHQGHPDAGFAPGEARARFDKTTTNYFTPVRSANSVPRAGCPTRGTVWRADLPAFVIGKSRQSLQTSLPTWNIDPVACLLVQPQRTESHVSFRLCLAQQLRRIWFARCRKQFAHWSG
jgi:hypothetical protein